jgi:hypothetical protein
MMYGASLQDADYQIQIFKFLNLTLNAAYVQKLGSRSSLIWAIIWCRHEIAVILACG